MAQKKNTPICITGGSGFIGRHLVRVLVKRGVGPITVIDHNPPEKDVAKSVRFFKSDFSDQKILEKALQPGSILIHLAGTSNQATAEKDPVADAEISIVGSLKLLEVAAAKKISKFIFLSSAPAVYGQARTLPVETTALPHPRSAYGAMKIAIEHYVRHYAERHGFSYAILRSANAYGPGQFAKTHGVVSKFAYNILHGRPIEIWGSPKMARDFIYVEDLADAIVAALRPRGTNVTVHVASGKGTTLAELVAAIEKASGRTADVIIKDPRPIDVPDLYFSIKETAKILGWKPKVRLIDGVRMTTDWIGAQTLE